MIKIFYDTETTGTNHKLHSIHQLAGIIEVDGEIAEEFNFRLKPHPKAQIDPQALVVCNVTEKQIMGYPAHTVGYHYFTKLLEKYINKYDPKQKAFLIGFNNRQFDDIFLRVLFELNGDEFFNSWFWSDSQDVLCLASKYLEDRRSEMPSFKLKRVALELGLDYPVEGLHDALFDATLTRKIYRIVTGLDFEI